MTKRITPQQKRIADAHIKARKADKFTNPVVSTVAELLTALEAGETFSDMLREVEVRHCTVTTLILCRQLNHLTDSYTRQVRNGFKEILTLMAERQDRRSQM